MQRSSRALARSARAGPSTAPARARLQSTAAAAPPPAPTDDAFTPALAPGQSAAYDAALAFLAEHRSAAHARLAALRARLAAADASSRAALAAAVARAEVDADINDPATRRLFRATGGAGHMGRAVVRELARRRWTREGGRDLLMQRVTQLAVVPDLVPAVDAAAALTLTPAAAADQQQLEPGSLVAPSAFATPPRATLQMFEHPASPSSAESAPAALHTLLVVDADCPAPATQAYSQRLHYLKRDIPLSVLDGAVDLFAADTAGSEVLGWEAPAPPQGSGKHRYVFVVLRQPSAASPPSASAPSRDDFDLRAYVASTGATPVALSLFRAAWSPAEAEHVSAVYAARGADEPRFGLPAKDVRYAYPVRSKAARFDEVRQEAWDAVVGELGAAAAAGDAGARV